MLYIRVKLSETIIPSYCFSPYSFKVANRNQPGTQRRGTISHNQTMTKRRSVSTLLLRYCQLCILIFFLSPTSSMGVYPPPKPPSAGFFYNPPTHGYRYLLNKIATQVKEAELTRMIHECIQNPRCRPTLHQL